MGELPKPKYDQNGRPIKKGISSIFNNNTSSNYNYRKNQYEKNSDFEEEREIANYKEKIDKKYNKIDEKFAKENPDMQPLPIVLDLNSADKEILVYYLLLVIGFFVSFVGLIVGLIVLSKVSNKINSNNAHKYKSIKALALILIFYNIIVGALFLYFFYGF